MFKGVGVRAALCATSAVLSAMLLASCGGGDQVEKFNPSRIVSFGDEASAMVDSGDHNAAKYSVNSIKDPATTGGAIVLDCQANPIWNQFVAQNWGLVFPECNPNAVATTSRIFAVNGAKVADVTAQIDSFMASDSFNAKTLVTILAGQNDILAQYALVKAGTITEAQAQANVEQAGIDLAGQVNRVGLAGGKVLVSTVPDVGTTPFGLAEETASPGRAAFLSLLTSRFNSKLRISLINDGKMTGLVLTDETITSVVKNPGTTFLDVKTPACDATLAPTVVQCTTKTLVKDASGDAFLWADNLHLSAGGQKAAGALAVTRATGNPF